MNLLIDIGHPAHVHYFRHLYFKLAKTNEILVTCKAVPIIVQLLRHYNIPFVNLGEKGKNLTGKIKRQVDFTLQLRQMITEKNVDLAIGVSASVVHAAKSTRAKSILFDDDDQAVQPYTKWFVSPFADTILSPDALKFENLPKATYYPGYHELAYLHPNRFTPDPKVLTKYGLSPNDKYIILRFNAFKAHHDVREGGMSKQHKIDLIKLLSRYARVFITTEASLDSDFEQYKLPIAPYEIHDFLYFSQMLVSDSQTMSTEAAVLGVPAFRCNSFAGRLSVLEEGEKKFGLTYAFLPRQFDWMLNSLTLHLTDSGRNDEWKAKRQRMLREKIDVTAFWLWFVENYPSSVIETQNKGFTYDQFR